jgi:phosphoglycolate phosphatase
MPSLHPCRLFLFDLDGTLIDSREDITRAVNTVLSQMGQRALSTAEVIRFVGDGIETLIQRVLRNAIGAEPSDDQVRAGINLLLAEYRDHLIGSTCLYPGVRETLAALRRAKLGLVTNKPEVLSRRLLDAFGLADCFCMVLGGDSLPRRKPNPAPILEAMSRCHAMPSETVMVGDSPTDIICGKAAGVFTCGISSGFRSREELEAAGPDVIVEHFSDLLKFFCVPKDWQ